MSRWVLGPTIGSIPYPHQAQLLPHFKHSSELCPSISFSFPLLLGLLRFQRWKNSAKDKLASESSHLGWSGGPLSLCFIFSVVWGEKQPLGLQWESRGETYTEHVRKHRDLILWHIALTKCLPTVPFLFAKTVVLIPLPYGILLKQNVLKTKRYTIWKCFTMVGNRA